MSIPLWFAPYSSRIKAARLKENIVQTNLDDFSKSLESEYQSLLSEYNKYNTSLDYYEKQALGEAGIIIDQATLSYKAGAMDYLEYIMSLNRALDIRQNYLENLYECNKIIISLEYLNGKISE
jgi:cobalt-zinc-cadmium resistance protein CzcA